MAESAERSKLLHWVQAWFEAPEQVLHYESEAPSGVTAPENWLLQSLPSTGSVLDLGCGAGRVTLELANRGYKAAGVDVSEALLRVAAALAEERNLHIPFARVEPLRLPFAGGSFDAVVAFKVYAYIPHRSARLDYLTEIHRVLRAGGQLLMTHYELS